MGDDHDHVFCDGDTQKSETANLHHLKSIDVDRGVSGFFLALKKKQKKKNTDQLFGFADIEQ